MRCIRWNKSPAEPQAFRGLVAIVKKRLNLDASLYTWLQIFSLALFEKMPIQQAFPGSDYKSEQGNDRNQAICVLTGQK